MTCDRLNVYEVVAFSIISRCEAGLWLGRLPIYPANTQRQYNVVQRCDFATL